MTQPASGHRGGRFQIPRNGSQIEPVSPELIQKVANEVLKLLRVDLQIQNERKRSHALQRRSTSQGGR